MSEDPKLMVARSRLALREGEDPTVALARRLDGHDVDPWPLLEAHHQLVRGTGSTRRLHLAREAKAARQDPPCPLNATDLAYYHLATAGDPAAIAELARRFTDWPGRQPVDHEIRLTRRRLLSPDKQSVTVLGSILLIAAAVLLSLIVVEHPAMIWLGIALIWLIPWWRRQTQ